MNTLGLSRYEVRLCEYTPRWAELYEQEAELIRGFFGDDLVCLHHIGSTSVKGCPAKPIIDICAEVKNIEKIDPAPFENAGYEYKGENGIAGRRYFVKRPAPDISTYHLHCYEQGHRDVRNYILFRDYLNVHPEKAMEYGEVKRRIIAECGGNRPLYTKSKTDFVQSVLMLAEKYFSGELQCD